MPVYFITGASRGIGLECARQLLASAKNTVIATARNPAAPLTELRGEGTLHVLACDVANRKSIEACGEEVKKLTDKIDYLFNNAGTQFTSDPSSITADEMQDMFSSHVIGSAQTVQVLEALFQKGTVILNMSSLAGSCTEQTKNWRGGQNAGYAIAKAAMNMLTVKQSLHYKDCIVFSMAPGWIATDMGGDKAPRKVDAGVRDILKIVDDLKPEDSGSYINYTGERLPF